MKRYNNERRNDKLLVILTTSPLTHVSFTLASLAPAWSKQAGGAEGRIIFIILEPDTTLHCQADCLCSVPIGAVDAEQQSSHPQTKVHFND